MNRKASGTLAAILAVLCLSAPALTSCGKKVAPITPTPAPVTSETTPADSESASETLAPAAEQTVSDAVDTDAENITGIAIRNAGELAKIGKSAKYPLDGDYVLVADIDMTSQQNFTPIGGAASECGIVEGDNVFSGTFDGRGHIIVGLKITVSATQRVHVGLFGSVGSKDKDDPAVIKNLVMKNCTVSGTANGTATYAVLAGQVSGSAVIDNISIISGEVNVENGSGDILGIAALIGQCRTRTETGCSNKTIHVSNIFTNVEVNGDNNGNSNYTSGLIGRIRGSDLGTLKNVLQLGTVNHEGGTANGNAVTSGDSGVKVLENVYYLAGCGQPKNDIGQSKSYESLCGGNIKLDEAVWHIEEGLYPLPIDTYESPMFSVLDFVAVSPANGESMDKVESSFPLTTEVMGKPINWTSSDNKVIKIENGNAVVTKPEFGYANVTLSARSEGIIKSFDLRVFSGVVGTVVREGNDLVAKNYPAGVDFKWIVKNAITGKTVNTSATKDSRYTLTDKDENCMVTLEVSDFDSVSYYNSNLPTVYITSDRAYYDVSKGGYNNATMTVATTAEYPDTAYDGAIEIKLRGNSTAYASKRPFKIKLGEKSDLFGMGANKHWCLLANHYDRTNLRNKISYDFGTALGLSDCDSILVNVVFNNEYYGLYEFTEAIRIGETRVNIFDWEEEAEEVAKAIYKKDGLSKEERDKLEEKLTRDLSWITTGKFGDYNIADYYDISGYDITGGYLIEDDYYYDEYTKFKTKNDMKLMLKSPEFLSTNKEMMSYLEDYMQKLEDAIYAPNRLSGEGLHYSEYMDVPSFVDFWMVNTLYKNVELLFKSCYMYKDVGGKITWGPVWDMDWTSANHVNLDPTSANYKSWQQGQSQDREYWYKALYNDPWFVLQLYERWNEIPDKIDEMFAEYDEWAEKIRGAAEIDNKRWGYDWTYDKEVKTLREWLVNRRNWMNEQMADPATLLESFGYYKPAKKIAIAGTHEDKTGFDVMLKLADDVAAVDVMLNGVLVQKDVPASDGMFVRFEYGDLREKGLYNAVEVLTKDAGGKYLAVQKRSGQNGSNANEAAYLYYMSK